MTPPSLFSDVISWVFFMTASLAIELAMVVKRGGFRKRSVFFHVCLQTFALLENDADGSALPHA
jgi:hypothetical protein